MRALSEAERAAELDGGPLPEGSEVRPGLWVLPQPMPSEHPPRFTLSYLLRDAEDGLHLIDPGLATEANHERLMALLAGIGSTPDALRTITSTHLHSDHLGLAARLRAETGARVAVHRLEQESIVRLAETGPNRAGLQADRAEGWGVPAERLAELSAAASSPAAAVSRGSGGASAFQADVLLENGEILDVPGRRIRVLQTPGHTPGSICLIDEDSRAVFTGDHLLPTMFPGIGLGGPTPDAIGDYLASLDALETAGEELGDIDTVEVLPGHGYRFTGLADRVATTRRHHAARAAEVAAIVEAHPHATVWEVASRVSWTAGWENLHGFYLLSALAQTKMHVVHVAARRGAGATEIQGS